MWRRTVPVLGLHHSKWSLARGPLSGTICTLLEIGWCANFPDAWLTNNDLWATIGTSNFTKAQIVAQVKLDLEKKLWKEAAQLQDGQGLEDGGFLHCALKAKNHLLKEGKMQAAFALDYIVTGVLGDPPIADKPLEEHLCHRCKLRCVNTTWHKY
jgi:hypothetical protein